MKKTVRIKENELVNLIDKMITENVGQPASTQNPKQDVENAMSTLSTYLEKQGVKQKLSKITTGVERGQFLAKIANLVGFTSSDMGMAVKELRNLSKVAQPTNQTQTTAPVTESRKVVRISESKLVSLIENVVDQAAHDSFRGKGFSHRGKEDSGQNYVMFNNEKFFPEDIEVDDYNSTKAIPRVENGKLIIANPRWSD
jgi:hypothetical protein